MHSTFVLVSQARFLVVYIDFIVKISFALNKNF